MEIGPVVGIRPVTAIQPNRAGGDLSGVFRIEFQREQQGDAPQRQRADRGLEDEDADEAMPLDAEEAHSAEHMVLAPDSTSTRHFFA